MASRLEQLADLLRCPACGAAQWRPSGTDMDGALACGGCAVSFPVARGVLDLGECGQDAQVAAERAAALKTERQPALGGINDAFDDLASATGELRDALCALPHGNGSRYYREPGYFANVLASVPAFSFLIDHLDLRPGRRALDLGADLTWSTCHLARRGLDCTAVDINHHLSVGRLLGAHFGVDYHLVRADMRTVPFRDASFDIVFAMSALHHNPELSGVTGHIARLLRPGGQLAFVEPYCGSEEAKAAFGREQIAAGISEQTYLLGEWQDALAAAGFAVQALRVCESFCAVYRKRGDASGAQAATGITGLFDGAYRGQLTVGGDAVHQVRSGAPWAIPVTVENHSHAAWCSHSQFPVHASYHLRRRSGTGDEVISYDNIRTPLPDVINPGARTDVSLRGTAITEPGTYVVDIDLVHEYITWFAAKGFESRPHLLTVLP
jgi:SAM-dependent methyltransferase